MNSIHKHESEKKVCDLCAKHDPLIKNYSEDYELQTSVRNYLEKTSGEQVNIADIARLCEACYDKVRDGDGEEDEDE